MPSTILVLFHITVMLLIVALLILTSIKTKHLKRSQEDLVKRLDQKGVDNWFRINISRPSHFSTLLKLVGFEAKGLLVDSHDHVRILAELRSGEKIDKTYKKSDLCLQWLGNKGLASSNMHWISIGPPGDSLVICADTGLIILQSREATADMCRRIDPQFRLPEVATSDFALEKNPASLAVVIGFFALLAFAIIDGVIVNHNELLEVGKVIRIIFILALCSIPCYLILTKSKVPSRESLSLSMLATIAIMLAYIPAIKRVDQFLSVDGVQSFEYTLKTDSSLEPVSSDLPVLNFRGTEEYWAQFEKGSTHHFDLVHGPLNLWQLDRTKLDEEFRQFYDKRNQNKHSNS